MQANGQTNTVAPGRWVWRVTDDAPKLGRHGWPLKKIGKRWVESDPTKPKTCVGCHWWIEGKTVTEVGFQNILGERPGVTDKDVSPYDLLEGSIHRNPDGTKTYDNKHAQNFDQYGCGFCHKHHGAFNPDGSLDIDFGCGKCHIADQGGPTSTPHLTHASLVGGEEPLADPSDAETGNPSCGFCHIWINPTLGKAACWNCHLSGHRPIEGGGVAYWKLPSAP